MAENESKKIRKHTYEIEENLVRFKLDIECSKDFANSFLDEFFYSFRGNKIGQWINKNSNVFLPKTDTDTDTVDQIPDDEQSHSSGTGRRKRFAVAICLISFIILSVFAFQTFLENRQGQALTLANYEKARAEAKAYKAVLAQNFDNLLSNLEELTAIYRFKKAFPEITSLPGIAMFKRGKEAAEKAEAAKGFIFRVKSLFDLWTERPNDLTEDVRPTKKDIADFLSVWEETEALLNRLEQAKENPLSLTATTTIQG